MAISRSPWLSWGGGEGRGGGRAPHSTQLSEVGGGGTHLEYHTLIVLDQVEGKGIRVHECVAAVAEHVHSLVQELRLQGRVTQTARDTRHCCRPHPSGAHW